MAPSITTNSTFGTISFWPNIITVKLNDDKNKSIDIYLIQESYDFIVI